MSGELPPTRRANMVARIYKLGAEPGDDISGYSTPEERLAMVAVLTRRMWALTGRPIPSYRRSEIPVRIVRK